MPANSVQVTFGANIQPLVDGIESIRDKLTHLAEAVGVAFTLKGIEGFVENMAALGLQTEKVGATLGLSNAQVVALSGFAKLTGTDVESLASGIERMSLNIQKSTKDATNPAAQALKVLGLNARDFIGVPADQWFEKLAAAVSKFNPSLNLTNALMAVGGRGVVQMLPSLLLGADHFREFQQEVAKASEGLAQAVPGMADTGDKLTLLGISAQSLGARIFTVLKPAIDSVIQAFTRWAQSLDSDTIRTAAKTIGDATISIAQNIALFFIDAQAAWEKFISSINSGLPALHSAAGGVLLTLGQFGPALEQFKEAAAGVAAAKPFVQIDQEAEAARKRVNDLAAGMKTAFDSGLAANGAKMADAIQKINAGAINMGGADQLGAMMATINAQVAAQDAYYKQQADHINNLAKNFQIGEAQKTAMLLAAVQQRETFQLAELNQALNLAGLSARQRATIEAEITKETQKAALDRQKINEEAVATYQKDWTSALTTVTGAFNSQLRGLLAGTTSWSQAWKSMLGDMIIKFIEMCEQMVAKWAAAQLAQTTATIMGNTARTASNETGAAASLATTIASAIKAITIDASKVFGGVFGFLAPEMGPAADAPAAAAAATVLGDMPSMDVGGYVMRSGLAMVHQGEVIPAAKVNMPYQGAGMGGGINAKMFGRMMGAHEAALSTITSRHASAMSSFEDVLHQVRRKLR